MFAGTALASTQRPPATARDLERARGRLSLVVRHAGGRHAIADLRQSGCARFLFPARAAAAPLEAVVVNTGGGLTGGDRFAVSVDVGTSAAATLTTQACEKVYASAQGPAPASARVSARLKAGPGARLRWVPQETILFERSALVRTLAVDMAEDADVLAVEALLIGRQAMGETLSEAVFRDSWRIRRGGRLVFAEEIAMGGRAGWPALRRSRALLGERTAALATIVHGAPGAAEGLDEARAIIEDGGVEGGVSVFDGLCVMRLAAPSGLSLRRVLAALLERRLAGGLPRVWMT